MSIVYFECSGGRFRCMEAEAGRVTASKPDEASERLNYRAGGLPLGISVTHLTLGVIECCAI